MYFIYQKYTYPQFYLKLRYPFNADISILRRDVFSALIEISAFEIRYLHALTFQYKCLLNIVIFLFAI